jgi:hypothetical protein
MATILFFDATDVGQRSTFHAVANGAPDRGTNVAQFVNNHEYIARLAQGKQCQKTFVKATNIYKKRIICRTLVSDAFLSQKYIM